MLIEELRNYVIKTPFEPFTVKVADGRTIPVIARDFILLAPLGRLVTVYQTDGSFDVLDASLIAGISYEPPQVNLQAASAK